jgi:hypothetical protein
VLTLRPRTRRGSFFATPAAPAELVAARDRRLNVLG